MIPVAELLEWLAAPASDSDLLTALEARTVAFVESTTERYFGPPKAFVEVLNGGRAVLRLREAPLPAPAPTVEEWQGAAWVAVSGTTWELEGASVYRTDRVIWPAGVRRFRVSYEAGYAPGEEPGDIRQAVLDLLAELYRTRGEDGLMQSETIGSYSYTRGAADRIPGLWDTLDRWRHVQLL